MSEVVFIDTETTGLDPDRHEIWDIALVYEEDGVWKEYQAFLPVDLGKADFRALSIGHFYERYPNTRQSTRPPVDGYTPFPHALPEIEKLTRGKHLAGAVVSFDEERLRKLFQRQGYCPGWHYHLIDVESLAAGKLGYYPPWKSETLSETLGIDPDNFERHTASGDAWWAKAIYDKVMQ